MRKEYIEAGKIVTTHGIKGKLSSIHGAMIRICFTTLKRSIWTAKEPIQ